MMKSVEAYRLSNVQDLDGHDDRRSDDQAFYKALIASLSDMGEGMIIIDNLRITFVNEAMCLLVGRSAQELLSWPSFIDLFAPVEHIRIMGNHYRRLGGEFFSTRYETIFQHSDGHQVDVEISVAFVHATNHSGVVTTVRDITERKRVQEEISRKNAELQILSASLEAKVMERTTELERANQELTRLNHVKSDFISIVSHELRTPLTSIKSFAEIMLDDDQQNATLRKRYLSIINDESDRLGRLISDVLDLQKIDAGKMVWHDELFDFVEMTESVVELFSGAYRDKGILLTVHVEDERLMSFAETDKLRQVFNNLLSNALKFTDQGEVKIHLMRISHPVSGQPLNRIAIQDSGIGMPKVELKRVFERFYQVGDTQKRKQGGTGLGLSICKDIIEHYSGTISVDSVVGKGSSFIITMPAVEQQRKKLGEVLVELGMLSNDDLSTALEHQNTNEE